MKGVDYDNKFNIRRIYIYIAFGYSIICGLCYWTLKLFKKAGKQGWEAIIPFYNTYVLVEISGLNWWYFLIAISGTILGMLKINSLDYVANIATLVTRFFIFWNIGKKMKQNHVPIAILGTLFAPIVAMVLGLSNSYQFDNTISVSPNGPFWF